MGAGVTMGAFNSVDNSPQVRIKAEYIAAIIHWTKTRQVADALTRDELKKLDSGSRLAALWRTSLEGMAHYLRCNPGADATLAVYKAICVLSDNDEGFGDMAQERLGRFLGRGRQNINECIGRLKEAEVVGFEPVPGSTDRVYPIVPRIFAQSGRQSIWMFDAIAPYIPHCKPGRKPKDRPLSTTPIELPVAATATPISKYLSSKSEIPVAPVATQLSYDFSCCSRRR